MRATIAQRLAADLAQSIVRGDHPAGAPLREGELALRYGVSRHVVREGLRTLAADGLVDYASFRGARVPILTEADARDIYRARRMVECGPEALTDLPDAAAVRACHDAFAAAVRSGDFDRAFDLDMAFHHAVHAATDGPRLAAWRANLMQALRLAHLVAPSFNRQVMFDSIDQHAAVLAAVEAGNADAARDAMKRHLDASERALLEDMRAQGLAATDAPGP